MKTEIIDRVFKLVSMRIWEKRNEPPPHEDTPASTGRPAPLRTPAQDVTHQEKLKAAMDQRRRKINRALEAGASTESQKSAYGGMERPRPDEA